MGKPVDPSSGVADEAVSKLRGHLLFFPSPAVHGWEGCAKASEPDLSGFVSRLSLALSEAR